MNYTSNFPWAKICLLIWRKGRISKWRCIRNVENHASFFFVDILSDNGLLYLMLVESLMALRSFKFAFLRMFYYCCLLFWRFRTNFNVCACVMITGLSSLLCNCCSRRRSNSSTSSSRRWWGHRRSFRQYRFVKVSFECSGYWSSRIYIVCQNLEGWRAANHGQRRQIGFVLLARLLVHLFVNLRLRHVCPDPFIKIRFGGRFAASKPSFWEFDKE